MSKAIDVDWLDNRCGEDSRFPRVHDAVLLRVGRGQRSVIGAGQQQTYTFVFELIEPKADHGRLTQIRRTFTKYWTTDCKLQRFLKELVPEHLQPITPFDIHRVCTALIGKRYRLVCQQRQGYLEICSARPLPPNVSQSDAADSPIEQSAVLSPTRLEGRE